MNNELFTRLQIVMAAVLDVDSLRINEETTADDLENWDSLGQMNLMLALEDEFGVAFTPEQITGLLSVSEILRFLEAGL